MKKEIIKVLNKLPYVRGLYQEKLLYYKNCKFPPGHFYSPIIDKEEVLKNKSRWWQNDKLIGIDLNENEQFEVIKKLEPYYFLLIDINDKREKCYYSFDNGSYSYTDGIILFCFLNAFKPKRIIEVGSGFSSALIIDAKKKLLNDLQITLIEPCPILLRETVDKEGLKDVILYERKLQDVPLEIFMKLESGDVLFIDSSHVSKTGSDVNYLFSKVIPSLNKGVFIHFHDIFYPFEYPTEWVENGVNWNEIYMLRNFLAFNDAFSIRIFSHYLHVKHSSVFQNMPLCYKNSGGNMWIEKIR